ncbi:ribonuclease Z [Stieleria maiorica]|uniref:Ribonuclease Z n=1 Tax=Stieleria maiorica TaxID=2795974 RepID=A0A5B9M9Z5_9BACT|nr:MBL fold metallo-hydrolase [Stieleria maiorica]QEF97046.1 ribonuclease Z [Stieleria maiorica]
MQLHCLGTAGYHPNEDRHTSCYFLPQSGIVLDAGTGLFRLTELIRTPTLDILLSHAHLDHVAGLTFLLDVLHQRPVDRLRIWGEKEKLAAIKQHLFSRLLFPVQIDAEFREIDDLRQFAIGDCTIDWRHQQHPGASVGYRIRWDDGTRLLYLTDTTGDDSGEAIRWNSGADLMMHECYFPDAKAQWATKTGHTYSSRVARIAAASAPQQLVLTHVNPVDPQPDVMLREVSEALRRRKIPVRLASDRDVIEFGG